MSARLGRRTLIGGSVAATAIVVATDRAVKQAATSTGQPGSISGKRRGVRALAEGSDLVAITELRSGDFCGLLRSSAGFAIARYQVELDGHLSIETTQTLHVDANVDLRAVNSLLDGQVLVLGSMKFDWRRFQEERPVNDEFSSYLPADPHDPSGPPRQPMGATETSTVIDQGYRPYAAVVEAGSANLSVYPVAVPRELAGHSYCAISEFQAGETLASFLHGIAVDADTPGDESLFALPEGELLDRRSLHADDLTQPGAATYSIVGRTLALWPHPGTQMVPLISERHGASRRGVRVDTDGSLTIEDI